MNRFNISVVILLLAGSISAGAQSAGEISAAKSIARSYGYSEKEINAVLNHNIEGGSAAAIQAPEPEMVMPTAAEAAPTSTIAEIPATATVIQQASSTPDTTPDIFGHSYFTSEGLSIIPSYNAPVPANYILGPGDEVIINVWGATNSHIIATIGNDGSISVLDLGPVYLSGMNVANAEKFLKEQFSRIYSGLGGENVDTWMRLSVGKIKGVVVNVIGEVKVPGAYTIPSLCNITSAIFMAGGVTDVASVRSISLSRNGRKVGTFDLYDFIFKGFFNENLRLQDGDIISVEPYHSIVSVSGAVTRPMRYEITDSDDLCKLIEYAGGFTTTAQRDEVHISRHDVVTGQAFDVKSSDFARFKLKDGDAVSVRSDNEKFSNTVTITGPVTYPGAYAINGEVSDIAGLVKAAGGLREGAYTGRGQISRKDENRLPVFITFDLEKIINGEEKVALMREDSVRLFSKSEFIESKAISVNGDVNAPGSFTFHEGMTVADAILLAKGTKNDAFKERGHISRQNSIGIPEIIPFNVESALKGTGNANLMQGDSVRIYSVRELIDEAELSINGEVNNPVTVTYREGFTLGDLIMQAGGFTNGADLTDIEVATRGGKERGYVSLYNLEENPELKSLPLKPYDIVSVRRLTYFRPQTAVTVDGEVRHPGTYVIDKAEVRLSDVVAKIGGFTDEAWIHGTRLTRVLTKEELKRQEEALAIARQNLKKSDSIAINLVDKYTIAIDLEKAIARPGSDDDVILRSGDLLEVPMLNNTVKITGGVFMPNVVTYIKGQSWRSYIKQAGGFTNLARRNKVYIMYMNGRASVRGGGMTIEPGSEIVVPTRKEKEEHTMTAGEIAALASSTSSLATLVLAITKLF